MALLRPFRNFLHKRQLWTTKRRNVVWGVAVGVFCSFMPFLAHSVLAVFLAILLRANVAAAFFTTFITNPITILPIFYGSYKVGCMLLGVPAFEPLDDISTWAWIKELLVHSWQPLMLGCLVCGLFFGSIAGFSLNQFWKWSVLKRRERRLLRSGGSKRLEQDNIEHGDEIVHNAELHNPEDYPYVWPLAYHGSRLSYS